MFPCTNKVIRESKEEIRQKVDEVVSFTISNIFMNLVRIVFAFWMPILRTFAFPLNLARWLKHKVYGRSREKGASAKCWCSGGKDKVNRRKQLLSD